jgi:hypothetical protein
MASSEHPFWAALRTLFELSHGDALAAEYDSLNPPPDGCRDTYRDMWLSPADPTVRHGKEVYVASPPIDAASRPAERSR